MQGVILVISAKWHRLLKALGYQQSGAERFPRRHLSVVLVFMSDGKAIIQLTLEILGIRV